MYIGYTVRLNILLLNTQICNSQREEQNNDLTILIKKQILQKYAL